jgi:hypothetical protein
MDNKTTQNFMNGCWEQKEGTKIVCRWIISASVTESGRIVGAIGGYSGGATFILEKFYGTLFKGKLVELWLDGDELIKTKTGNLGCQLPNAVEISLAESMLDEIWLWNSEEHHLDSDELILVSGKKKKLQKKDDLYFLQTKSEVSTEVIAKLCTIAGLTARPV